MLHYFLLYPLRCTRVKFSTGSISVMQCKKSSYYNPTNNGVPIGMKNVFLGLVVRHKGIEVTDDTLALCLVLILILSRSGCFSLYWHILFVCTYQ